MYNDGTYLDNNPNWHIEDSHWKSREITRILKKNGILFTNIAEVGCGAGMILENIAGDIPENVDIHGFDISDQAQLFWKERNPRIKFHLKDINKEVKKFDVILLIDVFEHIPDYMGFLNSLRDKADYFVFHIPLEMHVSAILQDRHLKSRAEVGHLHYFSRETALATLRDCGYSIVDEFYTSGSQEDTGKAQRLRTRVANLARRTLGLFGTELAVKLVGGYSLMVLARAPKSTPATGSA